MQRLFREPRCTVPDWWGANEDRHLLASTLYLGWEQLARITTQRGVWYETVLKHPDFCFSYIIQGKMKRMSDGSPVITTATGTLQIAPTPPVYTRSAEVCPVSTRGTTRAPYPDRPMNEAAVAELLRLCIRRLKSLLGTISKLTSLEHLNLSREDDIARLKHIAYSVGLGTPEQLQQYQQDKQDLQMQQLTMQQMQQLNSLGGGVPSGTVIASTATKNQRQKEPPQQHSQADILKFVATGAELANEIIKMEPLQPKFTVADAFKLLKKLSKMMSCMNHWVRDVSHFIYDRLILFY